MSERKSTYTGQTDARRKASAKYLKESVEDIRIRVPKGDKAKVQEHATNMEESTNAFVVRAITETMERDKQHLPISKGGYVLYEPEVAEPVYPAPEPDKK